MTTLREAAQKALEALEDMLGWESLAPQSVQASSKQSLQRLREALAHPDPEPVAWMVYTLDGKSAFVTDNPKDFTQDHRALPLYTSPSTPPPQHQADPVVWQFRMRPDWVRDKDFWGPWTNCTKEQAANYRRVPHLHDWTYESRSLYTHPPQQKAAPFSPDSISTAQTAWKMGYEAAKAEMAEQPEQEPVAWECKAGGLKPLTQAQYDNQTDNIKRHYSRIPHRKWQGLTDYEINNFDLPESGTVTIRKFVQIIEAKLKEKNT